MTHESKAAERLALGWHYLGIFTSLMFALFTVIGVNMLEPMTRAEPPFGSIFRAIYFWGGCTAFVAAAGVFWHLWAARQHYARLSPKKRKK
jgi:hypothetical protein